MSQTSASPRVLVTAAAAGIGRAIAEAFMSSGATVHICDIAQALLDDFKSANPMLGGTRADVSDPEHVDRLFNDTRAAIAA